MIPAHQRPGARVRYNYTDGPVPAGTLGTVLGFLPRSQQAQIRWDDDTVSNHTPDEYDVVPHGTSLVPPRFTHTGVGEARRRREIDVHDQKSDGHVCFSGDYEF